MAIGSESPIVLYTPGEMATHLQPPPGDMGAGPHLLRLMLVLLLSRAWVGMAAAQNTNSELHVVALVGQAAAEAPVTHFLLSACRLGYPSVEVVREWDRCSKDACVALDKMEHLLKTLPHDDLVIVSNLRNEYVYLIGKYEDARKKVAETGDRLLVAVFPVQDEGGTQSNQQGQGGTLNTIKERLKEDQSNKKRDEESLIGEREETQEKLAVNRKETLTENHSGTTQDEAQHESGDNELKEKGKRHEGEAEFENEVDDTNMIGDGEYPSRSGDKEKDFEGEGKTGTQRSTRKGSQNGIEEEEEEQKEEEEQEEEEQEEDDGEINKVLLQRAIQGGTVMGRVGTLLKALRDQGASPSIVQDTRGSHVVFGNQRSQGTMGLELPLKAKFYPKQDTNTVAKEGEQEENEGEQIEEEQEVSEPFIVYNRHEEIDIHNLLEVAWSMEQREEENCPHFLPLHNSEGPPRLLVNLLLGDSWTPFLEEVLTGLALQDYPKEAMHVFIYSQTGVQEKEMSAFMENNEGKYSSLTLALDQTPDHHLLGSRCEAVKCSLVVLVEASAALDDPATLTLLAASDRPVVGPVLKQRQEGGETNFVVKKGEDISQWDHLIRTRSVRATLRVAEVQGFRMVHRDYLQDLMLGRQVEQYINTRARAGLLLDPRGHKKDKLHPDLWGLTHNPVAWRRRYVHPGLHKIIRGQAQAEEVGKDLYYVPIFTERFCRELVEELEHFGQWQNKDMDDREESHRYTSTNINLNQIDYAAEYHVVINTLHKELLSTLYGGYRAEGLASLLFVLRYTGSVNYNTFKYHLDGACYTFNVALNNNFTGGGLEYRLGNKMFGEEKEILLPHNRTGWAVVQPDRPYHLHHGVPLLSGRRYALIAIVDTNDAGSKGGPLW